jgi:hypothetical protein
MDINCGTLHVRNMINSIIQKAAGFLLTPSETFRKSKDDTPCEVSMYYLTLFALNLVG